MSEAAFKLPTLTVVDPAKEIARLVTLLRERILAYSERIARKDTAIVDDLVQEGFIGLWIADPTRVGFKDVDERNYVWGIIKQRIRAAFYQHLRQTTIRCKPLLVRERGLAWHVANELVGLNGVSQRRKIREREMT